jgi:hypothetical protein
VTGAITAGDLIVTRLVVIITRWVATASRIEIRLLSETRSVFEYLQKSSLYIHGCDAIKEMAAILQFSNNGRSCEVES